MRWACSDESGHKASARRALRRAFHRSIEEPRADFVLGRNTEPGSPVLVEHRDGDEEISLQMIAPMKVPDAPPADLVPAEGPADDPKAEGDDDADTAEESGK